MPGANEALLGAGMVNPVLETTICIANESY